MLSSSFYLHFGRKIDYLGEYRSVVVIVRVKKNKQFLSIRIQHFDYFSDYGQ